jgi:hypothetical protein
VATRVWLSAFLALQPGAELSPAARMVFRARVWEQSRDQQRHAGPDCFCGGSTGYVAPLLCPSRSQHMRSTQPATHCSRPTCNGLLQGLRAAVAQGCAGPSDQGECKHLCPVVAEVWDVDEGRVVLHTYGHSRRRGAARH